MNTYTTHYESWLSQLYYYLITSVPVGDEHQSYHDLDKEEWWAYYDMGLAAKDAVKVFAGRGITIMLNLKKCVEVVEATKWRGVTQVTFDGSVYVPFEEYKQDVERLRTRLAELEEIHKRAEALFGKVVYRERDTSCSWRD